MIPNVFEMNNTCSFPCGFFSLLVINFRNSWPVFCGKKMLKHESLRTAVLIRRKVHWPNASLQSGEPLLSKAKLMSCAGLLLPGSRECRPPVAGTGIPWSLQAHGVLPRTQGMCLSSSWAETLSEWCCRCVHFWACFLVGPGTCTADSPSN